MDQMHTASESLCNNNINNNFLLYFYYDVTSILFHFGVPELQASTQGDWFKNVFMLSLDRRLFNPHLVN